jgi:hypothetical protein
MLGFGGYSLWPMIHFQSYGLSISIRTTEEVNLMKITFRKKLVIVKKKSVLNELLKLDKKNKTNKKLILSP